MMYIQNKIDEELFNINLWIQKLSKLVKSSLEESKRIIMDNWVKYNATAQKHLQSISKYEVLNKYFKEGDWTTNEHVEKSVSFLYSEELFFRFNRNLDALKTLINHHKKEDKSTLDWFEDRRGEFLKLQICPHKHFEALLKGYDKKPEITEFKEPKTK